MLIDFENSFGDPDGMAIDENGFLYVAAWGGSKIWIINPREKNIFKEITMPTAQITSVFIKFLIFILIKKIIIFFFIRRPLLEDLI